MTIRYYTKNVYGRNSQYPIDKKNAITKLTGRKTLTSSDILALNELGFDLVEVLEPKQ